MACLVSFTLDSGEQIIVESPRDDSDMAEWLEAQLAAGADLLSVRAASGEYVWVSRKRITVASVKEA